MKGTIKNKTKNPQTHGSPVHTDNTQWNLDLHALKCEMAVGDPITKGMWFWLWCLAHIILVMLTGTC